MSASATNAFEDFRARVDRSRAMRVPLSLANLQDNSTHAKEVVKRSGPDQGFILGTSTPTTDRTLVIEFKNVLETKLTSGRESKERKELC